jgi:hypothetical protein
VVAGRQRGLRQDVALQEIRRMTVAELHVESSGRDLGHRTQRQVEIQVGRIVQPLAGTKIKRRCILAALAQPQRMDRKARPVRPLDDQFAAGADAQQSGFHAFTFHGVNAPS